MAHRIFGQGVKKVLSRFELSEMSGVMPTAGITNKLYNDIVVF